MKKKTNEIAKSAKRARKTVQDETIEEKLAACGRKEAEAIIYVGDLVERTLKSEFGAVLKALTAGRVSAELAEAKRSTVSSDRTLGRLEMADSLWTDLEQFVLDKDAMRAPVDLNKEEVVTYNYQP